MARPAKNPCPGGPAAARAVPAAGSPVPPSGAPARMLSTAGPLRGRPIRVAAAQIPVRPVVGLPVIGVPVVGLPAAWQSASGLSAPASALAEIPARLPPGAGPTKWRAALPYAKQTSAGLRVDRDPVNTGRSRTGYLKNVGDQPWRSSGLGRGGTGHRFIILERYSALWRFDVLQGTNSPL